MKIVKYIVGTIISIVALAIATKIAAIVLGALGFLAALAMLLLKLALLHDAAEKYIGDSPSSMKWMGPNGVAARRFYKETEHEVNKALNIYNIVGAVSDDEQMWLHGADMLEFLSWCRRQLNMGNQNVVHVCRNSFNAIEEGFQKGAIPEQIYDAALFLTGVQTGELHRFGEDK